MKREYMTDYQQQAEIIELLTRIASSLEALERCVNDEGNMVRTHPDAY